MVIFCADESARDGELVGTSVSIPRGSRASSLWAAARVGAVTKTAARKNRHIICMSCLLGLDRDFRMLPNRRECSRFSGLFARPGRGSDGCRWAQIVVRERWPRVYRQGALLRLRSESAETRVAFELVLSRFVERGG